jgi:signal peptidase I
MRCSSVRGLPGGLIAVALVAGCGTGGPRTRVSAGVSHDGGAPPGGESHVYRVPSDSMEPTLRIGARVTVTTERPTVGAIVAFHPPEGALQEQCGPKPHVVVPGGSACDAPLPEESRLVLGKRVVAGPGDEIYIRAGHVYRKARGSDSFVREHDSYIRACRGSRGCSFLRPITIPAGHWFLMGDNRGASDDSRFWGPVPTAWIIGVVVASRGAPSPRVVRQGDG